MIGAQKARAVGVNHVALEVGDIDKLWLSIVDCSILNFGARAPLRSDGSAIGTERTPSRAGHAKVVY